MYLSLQLPILEYILSYALSFASFTLSLFYFLLIITLKAFIILFLTKILHKPLETG